MPHLLSPPDPAAALTVLTGPGCTDSTVTQLTRQLPAVHRPAVVDLPVAGRVSPATAQLLQVGDVERQYRTRSEALQAVLVGLANAGIPTDVAVRAVLTSPVASKATEKPDPAGWLAKRYEAAVLWVQAHPAVGDVTATRVEAHRLAQTALTYCWPRGTGAAPATISRVLVALLTVAGEAGRLSQVSVSVRQLAERAGVGHQTAARTLRVLCNLGVLRRERGGTGTHAAIYTVRRSAAPFTGGGTQRDTRPDTPPIAPSVSLTSPSHDAWRHGALGGSALRIAHLLDPETPRSAADLAAAVGCSVRWVRVLLARLHTYGLAAPGPDGWLPVPSATAERSLDRAAARAGSLGTGQRQRLRHTLERDGWRRHLDLLATRRAEERAAGLEQRDLLDRLEHDYRGVLDLETGELLRAS
jgi:hypothetical protein